MYMQSTSVNDILDLVINMLRKKLISISHIPNYHFDLSFKTDTN